MLYLYIKKLQQNAVSFADTIKEEFKASHAAKQSRSLQTYYIVIDFVPLLY